MLFYDGIKVYMQNGKLDDVEIAYYINKIRKTHKGKILKRISFILGEGYIDLRYMFQSYPFERIWRSPQSSVRNAADTLYIIHKRQKETRKNFAISVRKFA